MGPGNPTRILLIEDTFATAEIVTAYLNAAPGTVFVELADTLGAALGKIATGAFDLIIADLNLPDSRGLETLDRLAQATDQLIIVLTIENDPALQDMAIARGAYDFLHKGQLSRARLGQVVRLATMQANNFRSLRDSEAKFRKLLEEQNAQNLRFDVAINNMSQGLCFFDGNQRLIVCNDLYARMYKLTRDLVRPGTTLGEIVDHRVAAGCFPDMDPAEYLVWRDSIAISPDPSDTVVHLKDGRTIAIHHQPMADGGWVATHEDITERKRAEEELRTSRRMLEIVIDAIPMAIFAKDTRSNYVMVNRNFAEFFETSKQALVELHTSRLPTHDATKTQSMQDDQWVYQNRRTFVHETLIQRPDGTPVPFHSSKIPLFNDDGELIGLLGINRDISEDKRAQETLAASEARFRAVFERSKAGIATWGIDGKFLTVNHAFCDFVGYAADELVGKVSAGDLRVPGDEGGMDFTGRMMRGEIGYVTRDRQFARRDASTVWGRTTVATVKNKDGTPQYFVAVVIDITEAREARERIERMNADLEERVAERTRDLRAALKELDSFAYSVSHDLRAPVGVISGFSHLLRTKESQHLSDDGKHLLGVIEQNAERMVKLIDGLLQFSRLGFGKIQRAPLSMNDLARDALRELVGSAIAEVRLGELPDCEGDSLLLRQVWANLLGNAFKYSKTRTPARVEVGWDERRQAYFVRDNGVGFDMKYVGKLFGPFERLHADKEFEGSGIGLAIVQRIIERHGGTIWVEAAIDHGATFWFTVPRIPSDGLPRQGNGG